MSRGHSDRFQRIIGLQIIGALLLCMIMAFNLQRLPWLAGDTYRAEFSDLSGLHVGSRVEIGGIRVGRVSKIKIDGAKVVVDFTVDQGELGSATTASIDVLNLLGEKFLNVVPAGPGTMEKGTTIPISRTKASYDIVGTLSELTETEEQIDTEQLATALRTMSETVRTAAPEIRASLQGIARLSETVAANDDKVSRLLDSARSVAELVNQRKGELVNLMDQSSLVFQELLVRRADIHRLLVNATQLARQLDGLVQDNREQLKPTLIELGKAIDFLNAREQQLADIIRLYDPYASILINIIGSGPWFDAYVPNLAGLGTGEFVPGSRPGMD